MSALACGRCGAAAPKPRVIGAPVLCEACKKLQCRCGDLVAYSKFSDSAGIAICAVCGQMQDWLNKARLMENAPPDMASRLLAALLVETRRIRENLPS